MLAFARESYSKLGFDLRDVTDTFSKPGFWKLMLSYPRASLRELRMAISKRIYADAVKRYCTAINASHFTQYRCGIRAQAVNAKGELIHDFVFEKTDRMLHILNAPSPAATASIPIGEHIVDAL